MGESAWRTLIFEALVFSNRRTPGTSKSPYRSTFDTPFTTKDSVKVLKYWLESTFSGCVSHLTWVRIIHVCVQYNLSQVVVLLTTGRLNKRVSFVESIEPLLHHQMSDYSSEPVVRFDV